jgi:hypothetical protein
MSKQKSLREQGVTKEMLKELISISKVKENKTISISFSKPKKKKYSR